MVLSQYGMTGLKSHPQYELAKRQMRGYSGMVTFYINGDREDARKFLASLKVMMQHLLLNSGSADVCITVSVYPEMSVASVFIQ